MKRKYIFTALLIVVSSIDAEHITIATADTGIKLHWQSTQGTTTQVQYKTNLTSDIWHNLGSPKAEDGATNCFSDAIADSTAKYYRVVSYTNSVENIAGAWAMIISFEDESYPIDMTIDQTGTNITVIIDGDEDNFYGSIVETNLYFSKEVENIIQKFEGTILSSTNMIGINYDVVDGNRGDITWDWTATKQ